MSRAPILTPQGEDFPRWYQDVIAKAELADNGPVRGTMVIRPNGYAIWERMQAEMDLRIKRAGAQNAYFPLFIPESYLKREAEHVEGFSPELAVVTHAGGKELEEPIVVRPTSETVIGEYMAKWVQSYRDLPLLLNQWATWCAGNCVRGCSCVRASSCGRKATPPHATYEDARDYAALITNDVYADMIVNVLAVPLLIGRKTKRERFAGAINTTALEAMMRDGKALQMGTSHELGQNFAKAFDIKYLSAESKQELAWTTSWGTSARMVGGLIMVHGDDNGLRVPPELAPIQVVVIAVKSESIEVAHRIGRELADAGVRVHVDDRGDMPFGRRVVDWELRGVPLRIEVGPRDLAEGRVTIADRLFGGKEPVALDDVAAGIPARLAQAQADLLAAATTDRDARITPVATIPDAIAAADGGWASMSWNELGEAGEAEPGPVGHLGPLPAARGRHGARARRRTRSDRLRGPRLLKPAPTKRFDRRRLL